MTSAMSVLTPCPLCHQYGGPMSPGFLAGLLMHRY